MAHDHFANSRKASGASRTGRPRTASGSALRVGVELADFFQQARQSPKHRFPVGPLRDATEYAPDDEDAAMEMESEVFRIFNVVVSDINVEEIAADLDEPNFRIWAGDHGDRAMATLTMSGRGEGPWWKDLA